VSKRKRSKKPAREVRVGGLSLVLFGVEVQIAKPDTAASTPCA
jgi:hypothetical protein